MLHHPESYSDLRTENYDQYFQDMESVVDGFVLDTTLDTAKKIQNMHEVSDEVNAYCREQGLVQATIIAYGPSLDIFQYTATGYQLPDGTPEYSCTYPAEEISGQVQGTYIGVGLEQEWSGPTSRATYLAHYFTIDAIDGVFQDTGDVTLIGSVPVSMGDIDFLVAPEIVNDNPDMAYIQDALHGMRHDIAPNVLEEMYHAVIRSTNDPDLRQNRIDWYFEQVCSLLDLTDRGVEVKANEYYRISEEATIPNSTGALSDPAGTVIGVGEMYEPEIQTMQITEGATMPVVKGLSHKKIPALFIAEENSNAVLQIPLRACEDINLLK